jgi:hypothetical protein
MHTGIFAYIKNSLASIGIAVLFGIAVIFSFKGMRTHFISLLVRSWYAMMGVSSSSTFGFLAWLVAFAFAGWLAAVLVEKRKLAKNGELEPFKRAIRESGRLGIYTVILFALVIMVGECGFVVHTVFDDHQYFVAKTKELAHTKQELDAAKAKLLTTPYRGDRHLTGEQENALYSALRDVAASTPVNRRIIYLGYVDGDQESRRFISLFLSNNFFKAGWKVNEFRRNARHKDSDLQLPGHSSADVSVTSTLLYTEVQKSSAWKEQEQQMTGLLVAIRVVEQANMVTSQGLLIGKNDPLRNKRGFIIWVNPKQDGAK